MPDLLEEAKRLTSAHPTSAAFVDCGTKKWRDDVLALIPELVERVEQAEAVVEAARRYKEANDALEHRPHVTEDEHTRTEGWRYLDGTVYSEDEHSRRLNEWETAGDALTEALAAQQREGER